MELVDIFSLFFQFSLVAAIVSALVRIWKGPSDLDRVVAIEYLGALSVAFIAWYCWETGQAVFLDVAIAMAALGFIGTMAYSKFIIQKEVR